MDYTSNPFFQSPYIAQAGNNLIKAFNDDGRTAENAARTKLLNAQTEKQTRENQGNLDQQAAVRSIDPSMPISAGFIKDFAASGIAHGMPPSQMADMALYLNANLGRPVGEIAKSFVGTGKAIGKDQGFDISDREGIAKRENDAAMARTSTSAGIAAGASRANNADTLAFHERHAFDNPVQVAPEHAVYPNANDPRMKGVAPGSMPVPRMVTAFDANSPTKASRQEDRPGVPTPIKPEHLITQFDATSPTGGVRALDAPGVIPAAPEKPPHIINEKLSGQVEMDALASVGLLDNSTGQPVTAFNTPDNQRKRAAGLTVMNDVLQKTGNPGLAQKAYLDAIGVPPGSSVDAPGALRRNLPSWLGGKDGVTVTPPAGTTQAAPSISSNFAPPATAAPAGLAPLPTDRGQLKVGQAYQTAKGPAVWNGKNFDPAGQQNANDGAR